MILVLNVVFAVDSVCSMRHAFLLETLLVYTVWYHELMYPVDLDAGQLCMIGRLFCHDAWKFSVDSHHFLTN